MLKQMIALHIDSAKCAVGPNHTATDARGYRHNLPAALVLALLVSPMTSAFAKEDVDATLLSGATLLSDSASYAGGSRALPGRGSLRKHVYLGIGAGTSTLSTQMLPENSGEFETGGEIANQVSLGIDMNRWVSGEVHVTTLGSAEQSPAGRFDYKAHAASLLFYIGRHRNVWKRPGLNGFLRLGYGKLNVKGDNSITSDPSQEDAAMVLGAGAEYGLRNGLGIRADYIAFSSETSYGQLALVYRFGNRDYELDYEAESDYEPEYESEPEPTLATQAVTEEPVLSTSVPGIAVSSVQADDVQVDNSLIETSEFTQTTESCATASVDAFVDDNGCAHLERNLNGSMFAVNQATLTQSAKDTLLSVVARLQEYPGQPFRISAHTDNVGSVQSNNELSRARALSVARYILDAGVEKSRFRVKAYGESQPIASNSTEQGRAQNRRVEIVMLKN